MLRPLWLFALFSCFALTAYGADIKDATEEVAEQLASKPKIAQNAEKAIIIQVVNLHSQQTDKTAKKIETELYMALESAFPGFKLVFLGESLTGVDLVRSLMLKGQYEQKGEDTVLRVAALNGMNGEVIGQAEATFETEKTRDDALVAVLDIEAKYLTKDQIKGYSDLFRASLSNTNALRLASSADVDKMDPDQIQKAYGCTRDECATIIGEQLGVDRVISTSLFKLGENKYMLSGKMMSIQTGAIVTTKTVRHNQGLSSLDESLEELAFQLTGAPRPQRAAQTSANGEAAPLLAKKPDEGASWLWHGVATAGALGAASLSVGAASSYNDLAAEQQTLKTKYDASRSTSERQRLKAEYDDNASQMATYKQQVQTYDALTMVFALWEGYLIFFGGGGGLAQAEEAPKASWDLALLPGREKPRLNLHYSF